YHFTGWSGGLTGSDNPATITMDTDKSVTANFAVDTTYALIINAPNGSVTKNPDKQTYNPGETVTLQATASSGYHFTGWSGNLTGAINPTTVTMDAEKSVTANFAVNAPPIADAGPDQTVTDSDGNGSEQVNLDGSGSSDSDGPIASYAWSESGAQIATGANPNVMLATGIHTITLTVTDNDGATDTDTLTVTVNTPANQAPIANAGRDQTVTDSDSNGSEQVTLDGSGSSDSDGPIQSHIWSESGAQIATGANPNVTLATGIHTITLTVTDDDGASDTDTVIITVSDEKNLDTDDVNPPTVANCSPSPGSIQAPLNTLIVLHVVDVGAGVDRSSVVIRVENDIIYTGDVNECISSLGRCRRTGTKADYTFTYQPKTNFDYDQTVNVTVNTTDLSEKTMPEYAYSFKTEMRKFGGKKRIDLDGISLFQSNPATVRDSQGNVWVAWEAGPVGFRNIYVSKLPDGASYFENVMQITNNSYDQCRPTIAIDNNDKLYLAWQENPKGNWDIYFSSSTDGVYWISAVKVANTNANQTNPSLAVDSLLSNQVYLAWQDDRKGDYDIYFVSSNDDFAGKTIIPIATDPADQTEPVMAIDSENTVYVIWTDARDGSNDIYGAASDNGPWTNVPIVNNDYNQSSPAIALESEGNILHLLWVDDASGNKDICYGATAGGLPENPLTGINIVDDSSGADQSCPKIITGLDSNNNLKVFACWQDERNIIVGANDSDNDIDIYFSETEPLDRLSNSAAQVVFGTNIWVTDDDLTNAGQYHPVMNLDIKGHPYIVWVDTRNGNEEVYYTGTTLINSDTLAISEIIATQGGIVGTHPDNITGENDISVEIPAGAFWVDAEVSISRVDNPPSSTGLTAMDIISRYEFGPSSNLEFSRPVTIIIPYEVTNPDDDSVYWNNLQTGDLGQSEVSNVERIIISPTLHAIRYKTTHF
ncbi:MAG: hypothetical protein JXD22_10870, partial [Sedimentisphaerales bacterium]|nr:hypothetical protein [Sedimentisphaerales bacterium]